MSQAQPGRVAVRRSLFGSKFQGWLGRASPWLYRYRPRFRDWRFWVVQGLILVIVATHNIFEIVGFVPELGVLYFLPLSLLLVPVVYAALTFGLAGALATALWAIFISFIFSF
jgi:hypothetical protein